MTDRCLVEDPEYGVVCRLERGHMNTEHMGIKAPPDILYSWPCSAGDELWIGVAVVRLLFGSLLVGGITAFVCMVIYWLT